jgi:release factor glutamine methyltransferase
MDDVVARLRAAGCVYAEEEAALLVEAAGDDEARLERLVTARMAGEPLEPLVGWVRFGGLRILVGPGVFVPRVRTELLAETALTKISELSKINSDKINSEPVVVELCCGVAAVAAVIQRSAPVGELLVADIDPIAVDYARRNLSDPAVALVGDLYESLPTRLRGGVDVIVANAPYVPSEAIALMPRDARDHEPLVALDGGSDGTHVQRRIIADAPSWLRIGGYLLIETGREQSVITAGELRSRGFEVEVVIDDERDATVVAGRFGLDAGCATTAGD